MMYVYRVYDSDINDYIGAIFEDRDVCRGWAEYVADNNKYHKSRFEVHQFELNFDEVL